MPYRLVNHVAVLVATVMIISNIHAQSGNTFLGKSSKEWNQLLTTSKSNDVRRTAAFALGKTHTISSTYINSLIQALKDPDDRVQEAAAIALGEIAEYRQSYRFSFQQRQAALRQIEQMVKPIIECLLDKSSIANVRRGAACALGKIGLAAHPAADALRASLTDADARVRQNAAWAIGKMKQQIAVDSLKPLIQLLTDTNAMVRRDAAMAIGRAGDKAGEAVRPLMRLLNDPEAAVRQDTIITLGKIGEPAQPAAGQLVAIVNNRNAYKDDRREALKALGNIGGPQLVKLIPTLPDVFKDADPGMREVAAGICVKIGQDAHPLVPQLSQLLLDKSDRVRKVASYALFKMITATTNDNARKALPILLDVVTDDGNDSVRLFCTWSLMNMPIGLLGDYQSPKGKKPIDVMIHVALKDRSLNVRYEAARACVIHFQNHPDVAEVTPTLITALQDKKLSIQSGSNVNTGSKDVESGSGANLKVKGSGDGRVLPARSLGKLGRNGTGKYADQAKDALEQATRDKSKDLREAAEQALKNF